MTISVFGFYGPPTLPSLHAKAASEHELDTFCQEFTLEKKEADVALQKLKTFLDLGGYLSFEKLKGGDCNAPILVSKHVMNHKAPVRVLKREPKSEWAEKRLRALEEMKNAGCENLPRILKDKNGNFLITLSENAYSCIEYFKPDDNPTHSLQQMFRLAAAFHTYSKNNSMKKELVQSALEKYQASCSPIFNLDPVLTRWNSEPFDNEAWKICVKSAKYFTHKPFLEIYRRLPVQLIHGDMTPQNIVISEGKPFFVDLDKIRTDVRLLEFATFCGWNFLNDYLILSQENSLFPTIQNCYGNLEELEKKCFHVIVLFGRCGVLAWALRELKQALNDKDRQKEENFHRILVGTIKEINEIYQRAPHVKEMIK